MRFAFSVGEEEELKSFQFRLKRLVDQIKN